MSSRDNSDRLRSEEEEEDESMSEERSSGAAGGERRRGGGRRGRRASDDDEEESGEDLLGDNMMDDYKDMGRLDAYDDENLDARDYEAMGFAERQEAERQMRERDLREGKRGRDAALHSDTGEDENEGGGYREMQRRRRQKEQSATGEEAEEEIDEPFNLETYTVPLREWVAQEQTRNEVKRRFRKFLEEYEGADGRRLHEEEVEAMCAANGQSLPISYLHLSHHSPVLAIWLADVPKLMLEMFDEVATSYVESRFSEYWMIHPDIHVRITQLPVSDSLRELRITHVNALVKVAGVVTKRSPVFPQLKIVHFNCLGCGNTTAPMVQGDAVEARPGVCVSCQKPGPWVLNQEQTVYRNYQRVTLQESPGAVPAGRVPRSKEVILTADLVDGARPGEEVEVTGVYVHTWDAGLNIKQGFPVFSTTIEANWITKKADTLSAFKITDDDKRQIAELAKDPHIRKRIAKSIAPSIYGNDFVKMAVALSMFGGREKNVNGKHRIRGDINVLLLGDPGTAKSQVLKYVEKTAPRAVYTTGKGASAVGLTAAVHKDPMSGEWTLEGGALVLADQGVCLIDEFDKMNDADRTSIHEAMEQQSISISKAGIVTTLNARCAVIAAANPIGGRYDITKTFTENVQLTDPILTRFDILAVLRDEADPVLDEKLANFVLDSHARAHPKARAKANAEKIEREGAGGGAGGKGGSVRDATTDRTAGTTGGDDDEDGAGGGGGRAPTSLTDDASIKPIPQELLKKYIVHARQHVRPSLAALDQEKIAKLYADIRKESEVSKGLPVAVRHIESILRMVEASARMRLATSVTDEDINLAISTMLESFISAQKYAVQRALRRQFASYLHAGVDMNALLLNNLRSLVREKQALGYIMSTGGDSDVASLLPETVEIRVAELEERAARHRLSRVQLEGFLTSAAFRNAGFEWLPSRKVVVTHNAAVNG